MLKALQYLSAAVFASYLSSVCVYWVSELHTHAFLAFLNNEVTSTGKAVVLKC